MTTGVEQAAPATDAATAAYLAAVDAHMLDLLARRDGPVAAAARAPIAAGGKRLRPLLVRAARPLALGADEAATAAFEAAAVRAGAAVELVHTASLVHDDLLDGASTRRGEPTVEAAAGRAVAIAAGDLLFSLAFATLVESREAADPVLVHRATRILARTARTLAVGEAAQARQLRDADLPEPAYLERCAAKTGALFAAALQLGATLGGADLDDVDRVGRFGSLVGVAFQVADDVLDCGTPDTEAALGKRPGADLRDGTITMPVLRAAIVDPDLRSVLRAPVGEDDVEPLLARIRATGAVESSRERAHELRRAAERILPELGDRFDLAPLRLVAATAVDRIT
ncbi:MAG: Trans-hexaprenyltranstransferase [Thermoleophilia bacterium]|nr:Trans-hexaprenyltranstransferase [Thermoleophilia bacterium]